MRRPPRPSQLLLSLLCCLALDAEGGLISPRFVISTGNQTVTWNASEPVAWGISRRSSEASYRSLEVDGYETLNQGPSSLELLSGETGGLFKVRAVRDSCPSGSCFATAYWLVLTDKEVVLIGLAATVAVFIGALAACRRMAPPPATKEELERLRVAETGSGWGYGGVELTRLRAPRPAIRRGGAAGDTL